MGAKHSKASTKGTVSQTLNKEGKHKQNTTTTTKVRAEVISNITNHTTKTGLPRSSRQNENPHQNIRPTYGKKINGIDNFVRSSDRLLEASSPYERGTRKTFEYDFSRPLILKRKGVSLEAAGISRKAPNRPSDIKYVLYETDADETAESSDVAKAPALSAYKPAKYPDSASDTEKSTILSYDSDNDNDRIDSLLNSELNVDAKDKQKKEVGRLLKFKSLTYGKTEDSIACSVTNHEHEQHEIKIPVIPRNSTGKTEDSIAYSVTNHEHEQHEIKIPVIPRNSTGKTEDSIAYSVTNHEHEQCEIKNPVIPRNNTEKCQPEKQIHTDDGNEISLDMLHQFGNDDALHQHRLQILKPFEVKFPMNNSTECEPWCNSLTKPTEFEMRVEQVNEKRNTLQILPELPLAKTEYTYSNAKKEVSEQTRGNDYRSCDETITKQRRSISLNDVQQESLHKKEFSCIPRLISTTAREPEYLILKNFKDEELMKIEKNLSVSDAIVRIKDHLSIPSTIDVDLFGDHHVLSEDIHLAECNADKEVYIVKHQNKRIVSVEFATSAKDIMNPFDDDEDRVMMSCGHATTPQNLYEYYWNAINSGAIDVKCPETCTETWPFNEIIKKACLSADEQALFTVILANNYFNENNEILECPDCGMYLQTLPNRLHFKCEHQKCKGRNEHRCKRCYLPWQSKYWDKCQHAECVESRKTLQDQLESCGTKEIVGVTECPTIRACPKCYLLTQHDGDACKHMTCCNCKEVFCFICLSVRLDGVNWPDSCSGAFMECTKAPIQKVL